MTAAGRHFFNAELDLGSGRGTVNVGSMICTDREFPESVSYSSVAFIYLC